MCFGKKTVCFVIPPKHNLGYFEEKNEDALEIQQGDPNIGNKG